MSSHYVRSKHPAHLLGSNNINISNQTVSIQPAFISQPQIQSVSCQQNINQNHIQYGPPCDASTTVNDQIDGYKFIQCIMNEIVNITDFRDLRSNLKRYGIKAGPVRKFWKFINPHNIEPPHEDDENVVVIPTPSAYTYSLDECLQQFRFEDDIDANINGNGNDENVAENEVGCYVGSYINYIYIPSVYVAEFDIDDGDEDENEIVLQYGEALSVPEEWLDDKYQDKNSLINPLETSQPPNTSKPSDDALDVSLFRYSPYSQSMII